MQKAVDLGREKGLQPFHLSTMALFYTNQHSMHDAIALHYGWSPPSLPTKCECTNGMSVEHALSCAKGGFLIVRHNEIQDLIAKLPTEVCKYMCIEPELRPVLPQQLSGATANTNNGARLDISACGVWGGRFEKTYSDVRAFKT